MNINSIKCIFITFSAALLLLNSITNHYILLADENNPEVSKGFEFSIYKKGFHDLNASNEWAGCADALKELSNEVPLLTITSGDIQEYNWDAQVIILTKDATRKLRFALSHTDLISEHDIALQHLEKQVYESKGIEYDPDFHIGAYLYGDYNLFTVKQNRRFVYGGVFQSSWSNLRFDFPVARCHIIHNQLYLILLTNDTPFSQLDPRDEMGNFREIHLDSHGTIVLGIDDGTEPISNINNR